MKNPFLAFALLLSSITLSQGTNFLDVPYLETTGTVEQYVTPDKIYLGITINEIDTKGKISVEKLENQMVQKFKSMGIDIDKQLVIKDMSSNFKKYFLRSKEVQKSKYYSLLVYDGLSASKALKALEELEIANVYIEKTEYSKMESLKLELKTRAVAKAKEKAQALTQSIGQQIGAAIHIVDVENNYVNYKLARTANVMGYDEALMEQPSDLDFEQIRFEASVNVKFKLID